MLWFILAACDPVPEPVAPAAAEAARVKVPETDAGTPAWLPEPATLAGGASLVQVGDELALQADGTRRYLTTGRLLGRPTVSADGRRAVFTHEVDDGDRAWLVLLSLGASGWSTRTLLEGQDPPDRAGLHPDGDRVAFVWAGPQGGVAGVWTMSTDGDGAPVRLTNGGARKPGQPPEGFIPLPVGAAPQWAGDRLVWRSELGQHELPVPR